jgi:hypothetical protein
VETVSTRSSASVSWPIMKDPQLILGMMYGFRRCFTGANPQSMQAMNGYINHAQSYPDQSLIASFLDVSCYHYR